MTDKGNARSSFVEFVDFSDVEPVSKTLWPGERLRLCLARPGRPGTRRRAFRALIARDPAPLQWPYLRKDAPHIWRSDARSLRNPDIGVLVARRGTRAATTTRWQMRGQARARDRLPLRLVDRRISSPPGSNLDVIDPGLGYPDQMRDVAEMPRARRRSR